LTAWGLVKGEDVGAIALTPALTPLAFLEALAARIAALIEVGADPVRLRGTPVKTRPTVKVYGDFVYAVIRDPRTTATRKKVDEMGPDQERIGRGSPGE